jgi:hypothetical protein
MALTSALTPFGSAMGTLIRASGTNWTIWPDGGHGTRACVPLPVTTERTTIFTGCYRIVGSAYAREEREQVRLEKLAYHRQQAVNHFRLGLELALGFGPAMPRHVF